MLVNRKTEKKQTGARGRNARKRKTGREAVDEKVVKEEKVQADVRY